MMMGKIPMCIINDRELKVLEIKEGLLVTRNGKAGYTRYLDKGKIQSTTMLIFFLYVMILRIKWTCNGLRYNINKISCLMLQILIMALGIWQVSFLIQKLTYHLTMSNYHLFKSIKDFKAESKPLKKSKNGIVNL